MRAFVTGASGFLGGRLAQVLAGRGIFTRILVRESGDVAHLAGSCVEIVRGSLGNTHLIAPALHGITHIFHCAAASTDWAPWRTYYEANVTGTESLLRAAAGARDLRRLIHVSTTDVYGYPPHVCDESAPMVDTGLPYNRTKCLAERAVRDSGLPVTILRPGTIYGPRSLPFGADFEDLLRQRLMAVFDGGRAPGGFVYVDNAVDAMLTAAEAAESSGRVYNLTDNTGVNWRTYVDTLADGLGLRRPWIDLPSRAALALAWSLEAPFRFLRFPGRPLLTRHAVYLLSRDQEFPTERIRRELGFVPSVGFAEGMKRLAEWLRTRVPR